MRIRALRIVMAMAAAAATAACGGNGSSSTSSAEPWGTDSVMAADLAAELAGAPGTDRPTIVCTAPPFLYRVGHIPGAVLHGPMTSPGVVGEFTAWAQSLPRSTSIVIYCGCCPMEVCPNVRPAYRILKELGFTRVRVLILPTNFATDWLGRGHPVEK